VAGGPRGQGQPLTPPAPGPGTSPGRGQAPVHGRARLADERPFILLDPESLEIPPRRAASITGSARPGRRIGVAELQPVDPFPSGHPSDGLRHWRKGDQMCEATRSPTSGRVVEVSRQPLAAIDGSLVWAASITPFWRVTWRREQRITVMASSTSHAR